MHQAKACEIFGLERISVLLLHCGLAIVMPAVFMWRSGRGKVFHPMDVLLLAIFVIVYTGMMLGSLPRLLIDRTGIVLLGAILVLATGRLSLDEAWQVVDVPTMALLFGLMVVSAQFRLGGFYTLLTRRLESLGGSAPAFLAQVMVLSAALSALLANDIICLAVTPVLLDLCARRGLNPMPHLIGLACASNIGSAATLIGNPQNMLIGQVMALPFLGYTMAATVPTVLSLMVAWGVIRFVYTGKWSGGAAVSAPEGPPFDRWQTAKGLLVLGAVVVLFLGGWFPRELVALGAAGVLLVSRRLASPRFLGLVDWNLLVLFLGLFVINHAMGESGMIGSAVEWIRGLGIDPDHGGWLLVITAVLSNLVSNVPAVMLLMDATAHPNGGVILALASTFAGNLILVGSIANLIVVEQAGRLGVRLSAWEHARCGVPITLASLAITALWIAIG